MNFQFLLLLLQIFILFFKNANSQTLAENTDNRIPSQDSVSNFQPSLAVVIGMLSIMFSLTFILLLYAKFCHRAGPQVDNMGRAIQDGLIRSRSSQQISGLDKTVIESLPFFRFSSLKGSRAGLECAVCLSKFEDVEILRLLPKCKHAFHMDCIDKWLEKHSTCPLCRDKVSLDDISQLPYSNSLRFLWNDQSDSRENESNLELYVQREENNRHGSSRFSVGSSFRKVEDNKKEEELPIQENTDFFDENFEENKPLHKLNHKIVFSEVVLKNRWSNVSSSDLMFLNSEMLNDVSSARFSSLDCSRNLENYEMMSIKEEMDRKRVFESKVKEIAFSGLPTSSDSRQNRGFEESKVLKQSDKRSMSEIIVHPRFSSKDSSFRDERDLKEENMRRIWLPIARKTVQWFANREQRPNIDQSLNV